MRFKTLAVLAAAIALSSPALAHERGSIIVRGGIMHISPDVSSSSIRLNGTKYPGSKADIDSGTQLINLTGSWIFTPHLGLGVTLGGGYRHDIKTSGVSSPRLSSGRLGEVSQQSTIATLQFFPMNPQSGFQPYIGIGLNYTSFYDGRVSNRMRDLGYKRSMDTTDSVGLAAEIGVDVAITKKLYLSANVSKIKARTEVEAESRHGHDRVRFDLDTDPWLYFVGVGYRF
jgi:outer membrane protein